ncbi:MULTISPECIES: hypothetical protein [Niastella]|uniref:Carboxypeptidase-like regulatory domain-containing protein n=1 Tax=Niastella soli TaxID=2821487 RepID=A0ABS3Z172_9BACT|nr:hypothetical protein [Niastella soli]MBO9203910.1 hypothetical protein [Niastella soli]
MMRLMILRSNILLLFLVLLCQVTVAQVVIKGTVYDKQVRYGVPNVSVLSTSGIGTITDTLGHYSIKVPNNDSIYFSYLGKATDKFLVSRLTPDQPLDISLPVSVDMLPSVTVKQPSYHMDSLANRQENKKIFDFAPDYLSTPSSFGVGVSFDAIFNAKRMARLDRFRSFLIRQEQDKYVDHRFSKALVRRITGLTSPALDSFMVEYRPTYETIQGFETDYDYYSYIKACGESFKYMWKQDHPVVASDSTKTPINSGSN